MKSGIRSFLVTVGIGLFLLFGQSNKLFADAGLMPNAVQQFFDNNGDPLSSGTVETFIPNTSTHKTTWQDSAETIDNTNPIVLDAAGRAIIYGSGLYRQVVKDSNGNLIWDAVTYAQGANTTPTLIGDGQAVGSIKPWAGITVPSQYAFAYGQELSRTTYSALYAAITITTSVTCTSGNNTLTTISDTTQIKIGAAVEVSCLPAGTTVVSKTSNSVVTSALATVSVTVSGIFYPFGNGNGTTTFNVPDLRGYTIAGRDNMGGAAAGRLTTTYFGANNPDSQGATGGSESHIMTLGELATHTHVATSTVNDPGHVHALATSDTASGSGAQRGVSGGANPYDTASSTTGITVSTVNANAGSSTPFTVVQPTMVISYVIKILPDTSASVPSTTINYATTANLWAATGGQLIVTSDILNTAGNLSALTDAATIAVDMATGVNFGVTLAGNRTLGAPTNTQAGRTGCIFFTQDANGSRTLAYNAVWKFPSGVPIPLTTTANATDMLCYIVRTSTFITATMTSDVK